MSILACGVQRRLARSPAKTRLTNFHAPERFVPLRGLQVPGWCVVTNLCFLVPIFGHQGQPQLVVGRAALAKWQDFATSSASCDAYHLASAVVLRLWLHRALPATPSLGAQVNELADCPHGRRVICRQFFVGGLQ